MKIIHWRFITTSFSYVYIIRVKFFCSLLFILHDITINIYWNIIILKELFWCKKRFDCIPKLSITRSPVCRSSFKVVILNFFIQRIANVFYFFICQKGSHNDHFKYLFLNLDQSMVALLSSLAINLACFPLSFFHF